jgi:hypothetical protein
MSWRTEGKTVLEREMKPYIEVIIQERQVAG